MLGSERLRDTLKALKAKTLTDRDCERPALAETNRQALINARTDRISKMLSCDSHVTHSQRWAALTAATPEFAETHDQLFGSVIIRRHLAF